jgi:purine-binding chemotaxis protein CheW
MADEAAEINAILEMRAARLRRAPTGSDEETVFWIAEFPLADERFAVPLDRLRAAVPLKMVRAVPLSPPHVIGVLRFQGVLISALSLASMVGVKGWRRDPAVLLVVELDHGHLIAIDCEAIPKPVALPTGQVEEARARAGEKSLIEITTRELETINLIDLGRMLHDA